LNPSMRKSYIVLKSMYSRMVKRCKTQMPFLLLGSIMPKIYKQ